MRRERFRYFEADTGVTIPQAVEATPPAIVHVATELPQLARSGGETAVELPHAAINETLNGLKLATDALALAATKLADSAGKTVETITPAIEQPMGVASSQSADIAPDVVPPKPDRFIRRNGRKVKRG